VDLNHRSIPAPKKNSFPFGWMKALAYRILDTVGAEGCSRIVDVQTSNYDAQAASTLYTKSVAPAPSSWL